MFSCVVHNWNSHSAPCPMCFPDTYTSASGSEDDIVIINRAVYPCPSCAALQSQCTEKDRLIQETSYENIKYRQHIESQSKQIEELKADNEKLIMLTRKLMVGGS